MLKRCARRSHAESPSPAKKDRMTDKSPQFLPVPRPIRRENSQEASPRDTLLTFTDEDGIFAMRMFSHILSLPEFFFHR